MMEFESESLDLPGVQLIRPRVYEDVRGWSMNVYDQEALASVGIKTAFVLDYASFSKKDVIRGLHYQQAPFTQEKLIRCVRGRVLDVIVDHDQQSPTFKQYIAVELSADMGEVLYVPDRYAHGFCVVSEQGALVEYKLSAPFVKDAASGVRYDDPLLNIAWPIMHPILSKQDQQWSFLQAQ